MKSTIFACTLALILTGCAGVQMGSLTGGATPGQNAIMALAANVNTLKDQFGKPEMKDSSLKIASEIATIATSSKDFDPPGLAEIKNKEEAADVKKEFKGLLIYLGKTAKAYGTSVKENDSDIAKEDLASAVEIMEKIKKISGVK